MKEIKQTNELVTAAMMMCLIVLATTLFRIPIPGTSGYVHLGDAMIFLAVAKLGWHKGSLAAGLGSALADLLAGYAFWIPWTFAIKGGMALIFGLSLASSKSTGKLHHEIFGMVLGGLFMTASYFAAEGIMYGSWATAALGIPWNILQFVTGAVAAFILQKATKRVFL